MNRTTIKTTTSFILILLFLLSCSLAVILFFAIGWLHTYKVFTKETPVAQVKISALQEDENGKFFNLTINQVKGISPIAASFNPSESGSEFSGEETYRLYGDVVDIGGPTVKFKDFLTLFNFETVYKIAFVRAEYADITEEDQRTDEMVRRYDLNGGYSTWRSVQEDFQNNTIRGRLFKLFVDDLPQLNSRGVFVTDKEQILTLCVTEEGFLFCNQEL